jgi:hypothetical protein
VVEVVAVASSAQVTPETLASLRSQLTNLRIRELTGFDLGDPETHFNLELATRAWLTLQALHD